MKCDWEEIEAPDARGWRRVRCKRKGCGLTLNPTPHPFHKIHATCKVWGAGDYVAAFLYRIGITKQRVSLWLGKDCGCGRRQEGLNTLGERVRKWLVG